MKHFGIVILLIFVTQAVGTSDAQAVIGHCGDGNQRYTKKNHGDTVRYFADVNEFDISKTGSTTLVIEDTVECRYGKDTLINIDTVEFLDRSFDVDALLQHRKTRDLSSSVVKTFLFDSLAAQISNLGVDPFAQPEKVAQNNTTTQSSRNDSPNYNTSGTNFTSSAYSSNSSSGSSLSGLSSNYTPGSYASNNYSGGGLSTYNDSSSSRSSYGGSSYGNLYSNPYSSYGSGSFNFSNSFSASNQYGTNSGTNFTSNALSSGIPNASLGQITARWNTRSLNPNAIVYVEAVDSTGQRHYLGSAVAAQGERTLDVPSFLEKEESLTIYVRSGSEVVDTFDVEL